MGKSPLALVVVLQEGIFQGKMSGGSFPGGISWGAFVWGLTFQGESIQGEVREVTALGEIS